MNISNKKGVTDVTLDKVYSIIEKSDDIVLKNKTEYYCRNINGLEFLIELGKKLYKITCGFVLYEKISEQAIDISAIETIVSTAKKSSNDKLYKKWILWYDDNNIELRYFKKVNYDNYIYIFIALLYLEYGINFMIEELQEVVACNLIRAMDNGLLIKSKVSSCNEINEKNILDIANILSISERFYTVNEMCKALSFNENSFITYIGIYTCEFLALEHVLGKRYIADLQTARYYIGNILNICSMSARIPKDIYRNLRIDENKISKEFPGIAIEKEGKNFSSYYKVLVLKNIVAFLFISYINHRNIAYLHLCNKLLKKYTNDKMYRPINCNTTSRNFFYYFCRINNVEYEETEFRDNGCQFFRLSIQKKNSVDDEKKSFDIKKNYSMSAYREALGWLCNCDKNDSFLLKDELQSYKMPTSDINDIHHSGLKDSGDEETTKNIIRQVVYKTGSNVDFCDSENTLYIMKKTNGCQNRNHNVIAVTGLLKNLRNLPVKISVNYCENCKKFFINQMDFDEFCRRHGIMLGNFSIKELNFGKGSNGRYNLADESPLHYCGYNVNKQKGLTESDRHKILANIIDFNIMKKTEITEYLHFYINNIGNKANMGLAVSKWEDDLYFVNNYRLNKQRLYKIDKIRQE